MDSKLTPYSRGPRPPPANAPCRRRSSVAAFWAPCLLCPACLEPHDPSSAARSVSEQAFLSLVSCRHGRGNPRSQLPLHTACCTWKQAQEVRRASTSACERTCATTQLCAPSPGRQQQHSVVSRAAAQRAPRLLPAAHCCWPPPLLPPSLPRPLPVAAWPSPHPLDP